MQTLESGKFVTIRKTSLSINKQIILLFQRWVWAFRKDRLEVDVNTNNGLERQNEDFKHNHLASNQDKTLSRMLSVLVTEFLPEKYSR